MKDVETHLKREGCRGAVSLSDAQRMIATDWLNVYRANRLTPAEKRPVAVTAAGEPTSSARE